METESDVDSTFFGRLEELIRNSTDVEYDTVADVLAEVGAPTTSIAILENGRISSHCITTRGDNVDTLFQACSISKPAAGMAVMKLVELGHFGVDDKICDLLPPNITQLLTANPKTKPLVETVTVKQLMSHTAGLSIGGFPGYPDPSRVPNTTQILTGRELANTQPVKLVSFPGLQFTYSGGGITVLQCLVEHVMKKPFAEIMDTYVFKPLGMTRSCYSLSPGEENVTQAHYNGFTPCENRWHVQPEQAAAGLWTTPTDLLKLVKAVQDSLNQDHPESETFLKRETAQRMLTRVQEEMGLTWCANATAFGHPGSNNPGWRTFVFGYAHLPWNSKPLDKDKNTKNPPPVGRIPQNCGIAVMTNAASGEQVTHRILQAISYLKGWPEGHDGQHLFHYAFNASVPFRAPASLLKRDTGSWKEWLGISSKVWHLSEDEQGQPVAGMKVDQGEVITLNLRPAATPPRRYGDGRESIDMVLDGLEIMFRFGWDGSERIIEVWNGSSDECTTMQMEKEDRP